MAARLLWELAAVEDDRRFSPFCWRIRLALRHKGLEFASRPWRFSEKAALAFSGQGKVPVLEDDGRVVADSRVIAEYLEETYPDRPSLFGGAAGRGAGRFIAAWTDQEVIPRLFPLIAADIAAHLRPEDRAYFRQSREARLGTTLEALSADRDSRRPELRRALGPLRQALADLPFLGGGAPAWGDMAVFGAFQWVRCISAFDPLEADDPLTAWRERMLDAYDGEGRRVAAWSGD